MQQQVAYPQTGAPVMAPPPQQIIIVTQPKVSRTAIRRAKRSVVLEDYQTKKSKRFGAAVVAIGLLAMIINIVNITVQNQRRYNYYINGNNYEYDNLNPFVTVGSGIWTGAFYVLAGGLALGASIRNIVSMVRGALGTAIIALLLGVVDFSLAASAIALDSGRSYPGYHSQERDIEDDDQDNRQATLALCSISMLIALTAIGLCIAICDLAGKVICGGKPVPEPQPQTFQIPQGQAIQINQPGLPQTQGPFGPRPQIVYLNNPDVNQVGQTHPAPMMYYSNGRFQNDAGQPPSYTAQAPAPNVMSPANFDSVDSDSPPKV